MEKYINGLTHIMCWCSKALSKRYLNTYGAATSEDKQYNIFGGIFFFFPSWPFKLGYLVAHCTSHVSSTEHCTLLTFKLGLKNNSWTVKRFIEHILWIIITAQRAPHVAPRIMAAYIIKTNEIFGFTKTSLEDVGYFIYAFFYAEQCCTCHFFKFNVV